LRNHKCSWAMLPVESVRDIVYLGLPLLLMKQFATHCLIVVSLLLITTALQAQQFYVIVGAFAQESNAVKFSGYVRSLRYSATYELNKTKNYYYVYVLKTSQREIAVSQVKELQQESEFKDAWLFTGTLGSGEVAEVVVVQKDVVQEEKEMVKEVVLDTTTADVQLPESSIAEASSEKPVKGKLFKFVIQTTDGKPVHGSVHHVDFNRGRDIASYNADEYIDLPRPSRSNNPMSMVCGIFGYKEEVKLLNYDDPSTVENVTSDEKGAWVVHYELERLKKGDVSVMYHVSFYKDAVVMLPQAKPELDELVAMMNDNSNYRIKIHGHCNGNNSRRIIAMGQTKNYFAIEGSDERNGTAKELSKLRAEAVQQYLEDKGIPKSRSDVYAWGALNMLVPETSTSARLNDRIEIEITQY
jgi:outer membrane protein OmpA-like peptidoglycan-associated protein